MSVSVSIEVSTADNTSSGVVAGLRVRSETAANTSRATGIDTT